jgi:hypothetical protein
MGFVDRKYYFFNYVTEILLCDEKNVRESERDKFSKFTTDIIGQKTVKSRDK